MWAKFLVLQVTERNKMRVSVSAIPGDAHIRDKGLDQKTFATTEEFTSWLDKNLDHLRALASIYDNCGHLEIRVSLDDAPSPEPPRNTNYTIPIEDKLTVQNPGTRHMVSYYLAPNNYTIWECTCGEHGKMFYPTEAFEAMNKHVLDHVDERYT